MTSIPKMLNIASNVRNLFILSSIDLLKLVHNYPSHKKLRIWVFPIKIKDSDGC